MNRSHLLRLLVVGSGRLQRWLAVLFGEQKIPAKDQDPPRDNGAKHADSQFHTP